MAFIEFVSSIPDDQILHLIKFKVLCRWQTDPCSNHDILLLSDVIQGSEKFKLGGKGYVDNVHNGQVLFVSNFHVKTVLSVHFSVATAYVNQKKLDTETKILQANAAQFSKQTTQWLKLVEDFNTALKVRLLDGLNCIMSVIFSSTGRRPVSLCHGPLSVVRPSICPSVPALTFSLNIFSETTYQILMKFHRNVPTMVLFRISWNNLIPSKALIAMATKLKKF